MEATVRTVYGAYLQTCQLMGIPFVLTQNTTLNEKFLASQNIALNSLDMPKMQYVAVGNGGHRMKVSGNSSLQVPEPLMHRTTDAALFSHLPFVLRPQANDLTPSERLRYGLRVEETHDTVDYYAYYLRRMDLTGVQTEMQLKHVDSGTTTTQPLVPTLDNLSPEPPLLPPGGSVPTTGDYAVASARVTFVLDAFDITELKNVALVLEGSEDFAVISEMALVSGVEKVVSKTDYLGVAFNFNEVIAAQVAAFVSTFHVLKSATNGITTVFDTGATEPLWLLP